MGSIANVGGNGGKAIAEGWYGGMCVEGACGDCVEIDIHAGAVEGGVAVAVRCVKGGRVDWIGGVFDGGGGCDAGAERRQEGGAAEVCALRARVVIGSTAVLMLEQLRAVQRL